MRRLKKVIYFGCATRCELNCNEHHLRLCVPFDGNLKFYLLRFF